MAACAVETTHLSPARARTREHRQRPRRRDRSAQRAGSAHPAPADRHRRALRAWFLTARDRQAARHRAWDGGSDRASNNCAPSGASDWRNEMTDIDMELKRLFDQRLGALTPPPRSGRRAHPHARLASAAVAVTLAIAAGGLVFDVNSVAAANGADCASFL